MEQWLDVIILAAIAGFVLFRLYSTLGTRHGEERSRSAANPLMPQAGQAERMPTPLGGDSRPTAPASAPDVPVWQTVSTGTPEGLSLGEGLRRIAAADTGFEEKRFREGARSAWTMVVDGFHKGDMNAIRPFLAADIAAAFDGAVEARRSSGHRYVAEVRQLKDIDLLQAWLDGPDALIRVRFRSDQVHAQFDADGTLLSGNPDEAVEVDDVWTFRRDTRSRDPNWLLVETDSE